MSSVSNSSNVSRNFVKLSDSERAAKRAHLSSFFSTGATEPAGSVVIDSVKDLTMYSAAPQENGAPVYGAIYRDGNVVVPAQPEKKVVPVWDREAEVADNLPGTVSGPFMAHESFVVTAWFSQLYGGWNATGSTAINLWSHYIKGGDAAMTQGAIFDRAVANMTLADGTKPFSDSNSLFESNVLDAGHVYFFEVFNGLETRVMAKQDSGHLPPALLFAVTAEDPSVAAPADHMAAVAGLGFSPRAPGAADAIKAPFDEGIGIFFKNETNGDRLVIVSPEYHSLSTDMIGGASRRTLFLTSSPHLREVILKVHPEQAEAFLETERAAEKLAAWIFEYHYNGRRVFGDRVPRNIIAFTNSMVGVQTVEDAMARIKRKPAAAGLSKILKNIMRMP